MRSPYFNRLGQQSGVQISTIADAVAEAMALLAVSERVVAMTVRANRGRIDRAFLVDRSDALRSLGRVQSNLVRIEHEGMMQVVETLDAGAAGVVVSRLVPASAVKRYASVSLGVDATVTGIAAPAAVNEGSTLLVTVFMSSPAGAADIPYAMTGVTVLDVSAPVFSGGVTLVGGLLTIPPGISNFTISIPVIADETTEGSEALSLSVGARSCLVAITDTSLTPPPPTFVYDLQSANGWMHPTNEYNVPYIVPLDGALLMHPGPNLERPLVAFTNTFGAGQYRVFVSTTPDEQEDINYVEVVRNGVSIASVTAYGGEFDQVLTLSDGETLEFPLVGSQYNGGGLYIVVQVWKMLPSGPVEVADAYADFVASSGNPTGTWAYYYRSDDGYPNGQINSAGPMLPVDGGPLPQSAVLSVVPGAATVEEGESATFTVNMNGFYGATSLPFAIGGTASVGDYGAPEFSAGVTSYGATINVAYGVSSFVVTISVSTDLVSDGAETLSITVGGVSASIDIQDVAAPPGGGSTILLLPFEGANGSKVFTDTGPLSIPLATVGVLQISTAQSAIGGTSLLNSGSGYLVGSHPSIAFGTGNFTIRCRARSISAANRTGKRGLFQFCTPSGLLPSDSNNIAVFATDEGWALYRGDTPHSIFGTPPSVNQWYRVTVSRKDGVMRLFVDGVKIAEFVSTHDFVNSSFVIGCYYSNAYQWIGFIDQFEVLSDGIEVDV